MSLKKVPHFEATYTGAGKQGKQPAILVVFTITPRGPPSFGFGCFKKAEMAKRVDFMSAVRLTSMVG
jgi:hypothetical protein